MSKKPRGGRDRPAGDLDAGNRSGTGGRRLWIGILAAVVAAFVAGLAFPGGGLRVSPGEDGVERATISFSRYTSPFLECAGTQNGDVQLVRAREEVVNYLSRVRNRDPSLQVSVYARDLNNGPWIGIDESRLFVPASLNKVPVMMYILSQAESDSSLLDRLVQYPGPEAMAGEASLEEDFQGPRMEEGAWYSYRELLFRMIAYSDNHAKELLLTGVSAGDVEGLMEVVHAGSDWSSGEPLVNARTYASIFRVLYNSNFLGRAMSEYALDLLTRSYFQGGIRRFIPEEIPIASKFGFYRSPEQDRPAAQLHECGIIYQPNTPYVLCVLTRSGGSSEDEMAQVMADVSRIIWQTKNP